MPDPWFSAGLRFSCTQCGNCCTGESGHTWVSESEIDVLAARLGLDRASFCRTYTRTVWRGGKQLVSLTEKRNRDCVFWAEGVGCTVYELRPRQCRTWPFWRSNLDERVSWDEQARGCPGMNRGAQHDAGTIAATAADDGLPD